MIMGLIELYAQYFPQGSGHFVEVGAFDGYHWSNTLPLILQGWRGLMFEPYQEFYEMCRDRYRDNPLIEVEQCAIAETCGPVKLFPGGSMTTIEEGLIEIWNKEPALRFQGLSVDKFVMCEAHTLDCRLKAHDCPNGFGLLSIDAEGADDRVLMGLDLTTYRPLMIIIELALESKEPIVLERVKWIQEHLGAAGYEFIYRDIFNSIYWRKEC